METSWPEEHLSDCNLFILALPSMKKADECKMFQSNEMLENQYFVSILGNWSAARVKIIQKELLWTNFDEIRQNLEYHDYCVVSPCILFQLYTMKTKISLVDLFKYSTLHYRLRWPFGDSEMKKKSAKVTDCNL